MSQTNSSSQQQAAIAIIKARKGRIRMAEAVESGINRRTLYSLRDTGIIEQISRGVYRLKNLPALSRPDIASRAPHSVIRLVSALSFHEIARYASVENQKNPLTLSRKIGIIRDR